MNFLDSAAQYGVLDLYLGLADLVENNGGSHWRISIDARRLLVDAMRERGFEPPMVWLFNIEPDGWPWRRW